MKLLHSMAYRLSTSEDENQSLRKENQSLREENHELRRELCALRTSLARDTGRKPEEAFSRPSTSRLTGRSTTSEETTPSYAQSTKASRSRSSPSSPPSSTSTSPEPNSASTTGTTSSHTLLKVNGTSYTYQDGKLNVMRLGYLRSTASRYNYQMARLDLYPHTALSYQIRTAEWAWTDGSRETYDTDWSEKQEINHAKDPEPANTLQIMSQTEWDDMTTQRAIADRTRLRDKAWARGIPFNLYIDHNRLFAILSEAFALAKRSLWLWKRTHRPEDCDTYLYDVDIGRDKIDQWIPSEEFRSSQRWQFEDRLDHLIRLRNLVSHFNGAGQDVRFMDELVEGVQKLAVLLYDEESASHARALRDRLRAEAERTLQEIEALTMWTALPEAGDPWLRHHSATVREAVDQLEEGCDHPHQHILVTAAREWASRHRKEDYGGRIPEAETNTETRTKSAQAPSQLDIAGAERQTDKFNKEEARHMKRRGSFSAVFGFTDNIIGGQGEMGHRRRTTSL